MAKVDLSKFIDNNLKAEFLAKPYSVEKDRGKLAARFTTALNQFPSSKAPNKIWKLSNGVVEVKVPLGSGLLTIGGSTINYVPESQFKGFIAALVDATNEGEFDGALKAVQTAPQASQKASKASGTKFGSLAGVRRSVGKMPGKSDAEIREYLEGHGVFEEWIADAIANRPKK